MGEARSRGSREVRVAEAARVADSRRPPTITCNACQLELAKVVAVDTQGLRGIDVAFQAHCAACDQDTWAVRGEAVAVRAFYDALAKASGQQVQMGIARQVAKMRDPDASFIEASNPAAD